MRPQTTDIFRPPRRRRHGRRFVVLASIAAGGGLGSLARLGVETALPIRPGQFPWATFLANVSGCLVLGALMVFIMDVWPPGRYARPFAAIGFLGGFTTFSALTTEAYELAAHGEWALANAYVLNSLIGGLVAVFCGGALARLISRRRS